MRDPFGEACNSSAMIGNQHANGKELVQEGNLPEKISLLGSMCDRSSRAMHDLWILGYQVGDKQIVLTRVGRSLNELGSNDCLTRAYPAG